MHTSCYHIYFLWNKSHMFACRRCIIHDWLLSVALMLNYVMRSTKQVQQYTQIFHWPSDKVFLFVHYVRPNVRKCKPACPVQNSLSPLWDCGRQDTNARMHCTEEAGIVHKAVLSCSSNEWLMKIAHLFLLRVLKILTKCTPTLASNWILSLTWSPVYWIFLTNDTELSWGCKGFRIV